MKLAALMLAALALGAQDGTTDAPTDGTTHGTAAPLESPEDARGEDSAQAEAAAQPAPEPSEAPVEPTQDDLWRPLASPEELTLALDELAAAQPDWIEVFRLKPGADGRALELAVLGERGAGDPSRRPGLLLMPVLTDDSSVTPATLVALVRWFERELARGSAEVRDLLRRATLYVLPAPRNDGLLQAPPARRVDPARNFPGGWLPWGEGETGPYPLSEPECLAVCDFLYWRPNIACCLMLSSAAPFAAGDGGWLGGDEAELSSSLAAAVGALGAEEPTVFGLDTLEARGGSLARHADRALGIWVFQQAPSNAAVADRSAGSSEARIAAAREELPTLAARASALANLLPRVVVGAPEVERLGEDLWRVDVTLTNAGRLPSGARDGSSGSARVKLELTGAGFAAAMVREEGEVAFVPVPTREARVDLGHLDGGEQRTLRAIVRADAGSELELVLTSARAGGARVKVLLPDG